MKCAVMLLAMLSCAPDAPPQQPQQVDHAQLWLQRARERQAAENAAWHPENEPQTGPSEDELKEQLAQRKVDNNPTFTANQAKLDEVRAAALPADYKAKIDANLEATLRDPESRKVTYGALPGGSLVCGTINSKNGFGGYAGPGPFVAWFKRDGALADVVMDIDTSGFEACNQRDCEEFSVKRMLRACKEGRW